MDEVRAARVEAQRRAAYARSALALERDDVPAEAVLDVAVTNGLAAIVAREHPARLADGRRVKSATQLLDVCEEHGVAGVQLDCAALRDGVVASQSLRHGRPVDGIPEDFEVVGSGHVAAVLQLDAHPSLRVLERAREFTSMKSLIEALFRDAIEGLRPFSPKDRLDGDVELCEACGEWALFVFGVDVAGFGFPGPAVCLNCGSELTEEDADMAAFRHQLGD